MQEINLQYFESLGLDGKRFLDPSEITKNIGTDANRLSSTALPTLPNMSRLAGTNTDIAHKSSSTAVLLLPHADAAASVLTSVSWVLACGQAYCSRPLVLVSSACYAPFVYTNRPLVSRVAHSGPWGLARTMRLEALSQAICNVDLTGMPSMVPFSLVASCVDQHFDESETAWHTAASFGARLRHSSGHLASSLCVSPLWMITGGSGSLGLRSASHLIKAGACSVFLCSRSGRIVSERRNLPIAPPEVCGTNLSKATLCCCNLVDQSETLTTLGAHTPSGILHASGVLDDLILLRMTQTHLRKVFAPKAVSAAHLHTSSSVYALGTLMVLSSIAALLGNIGQANYSAANACLEGIVRYRAALATEAHGLQLPLIAGSSMASDMVMETTVTLTLDEFATSLVMGMNAHRSSVQIWLPLQPHAALVTGSSATYGVLLSELRTEVLHRRPVGDQGIDASTGTGTGTQVTRRATTEALYDAESCAGLESLVMRAARQACGGDATAVGLDVPLLGAGIDSLAATELSSRLSDDTGLQMSPMLLFELPTVRDIVAHILSRTTESCTHVSIACRSERVSHNETQPGGAKVALMATASRWPGGVSISERRDTMLFASGDAIANVPSQRFPVFNLPPQFSRFGGFLAGLDLFDAAAFNVVPAEASNMDPQQRLLLEVGYSALHAQEFRRTSLAGTDTAVLIGIDHLDWQLKRQAIRVKSTSAEQPTYSVYAFSGEHANVASGRLAFTLNLHGPSSTFNTACSSSLVAVNSAMFAVRYNDCKIALVAGVRTVLMPFPLLNLHASDGRCKSFDARADGYGRSEGVGAACLGDSTSKIVYVGGCAVRAGGRSASLTSPNGSAISATIRLALERAEASAADLSCIQAQGLGSALVDPIEAAGIQSVAGKAPGSVMAVCCHKPNVGHSEAASGMSGIVTAQHALQGASVMSNAQLRVVNTLILNVAVKSAAFVFPLNSQPHLQIKLSGVTAFGWSGTFAHVILQLRGLTFKMEPRLTVCRGGNHWSMVTPHKYQRQRSRWHELLHPFAQFRILSSGVSIVYRSPAAGALHACVADHVIQGRVIFPGTGYLEMARAASASALHGVYFLQPLAVEAPGFLVECAVFDGRFEVRSDTEGTGREGSWENALVHCSGSTATSEAEEALDDASLRTFSFASDVKALYDGCAAVGLQYGPGYRTLTQAWGGESDAIACLRPRSTRNGTQVHPADLDDALCVHGFIATGNSDETRVPFAVDAAVLPGAPGKLWAVRLLSCHELLPL